MAIRYDKKLNREIDKAIKNYNQKIDRLRRQGFEILPDRISKKELKESVYNRGELFRKINELKSFSERGAEKVTTTKGGVRITEYEIKRIKKERKRILQKLTKEINVLETEKPRVFGKVQASTFSQMGDTHYLNLKEKRDRLLADFNLLNLEEYKRYIETLGKVSKNMQYYDNLFKESYFKMLTDLAYFYGYDTNKLNEMKEKLFKLPSSKFMKLFQYEKSIRAILDYYPMITKTGYNPMNYKDDVTVLYDTLYENLDEILKEY